MNSIVTNDIIRAAEGILQSRKFSRDDTDYKMARGMIIEAIVMERERCAKAVEDMFDDDGFPIPYAPKMAESIRRGEA